MPKLKDLIGYFIKLGATGFGGPVALINRMERDLVQENAWYSPDEFKMGLLLSQLAPGPMATQLAIYLGWLRGNCIGATLITLAFVAPSMIIVMLLAQAYISLGQFLWLQSFLYGMGAAVIAIMLVSSIRLVQRIVHKQFLLLCFTAISAAYTFLSGKDLVLLIVAAGLINLFIRKSWNNRNKKLLGLNPAILGSSVFASTSFSFQSSWVKLLIFLFKSGAFVFGSGLVIVPFLKTGVVDEFHMLTLGQFRDAVAVGMLTPGPIVIAVAFMGYLIGGPTLAVLSALAVFLPVFLITIFAAPYLKRLVSNPDVQNFVNGATAAAVGALFPATWFLAKTSIVDIPTFCIFLISFLFLLCFRRSPELVLVALSGMGGFLIKTWL